MSAILAYDDKGSGSAVVLIHAGIADRRMWRWQLPALVSAGFRVLAVDLRGFGDSPPASEPYSHTDDLLACLDARGIERATVVGVSMAGGVAIDLALIAPERVAGLVLVSTGAGVTTTSETLTRVWDESEAAFERGDLERAIAIEVEAWVIGHGRSASEVGPDYLALATAMVRRTGERAASGLETADQIALDPPRTERLGEIAARTLLVVGDRDLPDIEESIGRLAAAIPTAERATIADCAHLPPLEHPEAFNRLLLDFLSSESTHAQTGRGGPA
jgi:3-oxoadipate enol-lactonase